MLKKVAIFLFLIVFIFVVTIIVQYETGKSDNNEKAQIEIAQTETTQNETETLKDANPELMLASEIDLDDTKITAIAELLDKCGIVKLNKVEFFSKYDDKDDDSGTIYYLDAVTSLKTRIDLMLCLLLDGTVDQINVKMRDTQIYADGKIKYGFLTTDEENTYRVSSELLIKELLLSPSSAKYPSRSEWNIFRDDEFIVLQSSVESKNAFGVEIKSKFQLKWVNGNPASLILDGKEYF